jgi:glycosyltransferase 2 family protein
MLSEGNQILRFFSAKRILYAILIGLGAAFFLLHLNFDKDAFLNITWTWQVFFWLFVALVMMALRDIGYIIRIRILSDKTISWRNCFDVIMLWEFASAITPSVVGGSAIAMFIVNKEGINLGKSSAIVLITALMDELFFVLMVPLLFWLVGEAALFPMSLNFSVFGYELNTKGIFYLSYAIIVLYVIIISYALIFKPRGFKWILLTIFKLPFMRKWRVKASQTGQEIIEASKEIRSKKVSHWLKAFLATFLSWTARYWVLNFIILAFAVNKLNSPFTDNLLIYARQLVMWIVMLVSPTPGGSGVAELTFLGFLKEFVPNGLESGLALLWRLISYYPYLFIGAIVLPRWIRRVFAAKTTKN